MRFRLAPRLITLDDLDLKFEFSENFAGFQISEATITAKRMKIDLCCQRQRCNPVNVLFNVMFLALICRRFLR